MTFKKTVTKNEEIGDCYQKGLKAMGKYSKKVIPKNANNISGSVNLEECLSEPEEGEARWDYMVGYEGEAYFIEVHPADSKNVGEMIKKVQWLKQWLKQNPDIKGLTANKDPFRWVSTNGYNIKGRYEKRIAENGLTLPKEKTTLP